MMRADLVCYPWRRFLARALDMLVYNVLWMLILRLVFNVSLLIRGSFNSYLDLLIILLLMLLSEPVLLHRFGTTPGKALFGIRIETSYGSKLSYWGALERTWKIIGDGLGYGIPILNIVRLWNSYKLCTNKQMQPWDYEITYSVSDTKLYRGVIYVAAAVLVIFAMALTISVDQVPPNRGDLTIDEFADNFNYLTYHYKGNIVGRHLLSDGKWNQGQLENNINYPEFFYTLENGYIKEAGFKLEIVDYDGWIPSYEGQMVLAALSFVGAQEDIGLFSNTRKDIMKRISGNSLESFVFEESGVRVSCDIEYSGYMHIDSVLVKGTVLLTTPDPS